MKSMQKLGIDIGTSTIKIVLQGTSELVTLQQKHYGSVQSVLYQMLLQTANHIEKETVEVAVTGQGARQIQWLVPQLHLVEEIPAITNGVKWLVPEAASIIEIGCQNARYITGLNAAVPQFAMNEHCAGGTGSFFEAQMSRLGLDMSRYSEIVTQAKSIPNMSGRCAVFAKSDMIHRQQEQVPAADILLGLCYAMVRNFRAVIMGRLPVEKPIVFCGGVAENKGVIFALKDVLKLSDEELIVPVHYRYAAAIGAALSGQEMIFHDLLQQLQHIGTSDIDNIKRLPQLPFEAQAVMEAKQWPEQLPEDGCYLGIDIGSTSTNLVLVGTDDTLLGYQYLRTGGDPLQAVETGIAALKQRYGMKLPILAIGVTGSGRERIGKMIQADIVRDEITSQAKAAASVSPGADTVFEIGGQDSKYIALKNRCVEQFQMNKICAAGTGAFIEEQAARMKIAITEFGPLALTAEKPVDLGDRCTVFIESAIASAIVQGARQEEIAAGLCYSIVQNYLNKVVGNRPVGEHIVLQGGIAYNPGIVAAFRHRYGERLHISPVFAVSGAFGVALLAAEAASARQAFRTVEISRNHETIVGNQNAMKEKNLLLKEYNSDREVGKKTVGIPYALMIHKFFPMANAFFKELGFNVLLSSASNKATIARAQELASSETCYPVKLIYGHVQELVEQNVDYIFMPSVRTLKHETSKVENNYGCVYMQTAPKLVYDAMHLQGKGIILLNPAFDLDFGQQAMAMSMVALGESMGFSKPKCMKALMAGAMAVRKHSAAVEAQGKQMLEQLNADDKVLVIVTRNYGIGDPVLNMGIPQLLRERGYKVLTLSHLPAHDLDLSADHPDLCWPFGQHILSGAKIIKNHPNLYAVYLTNHGCGPDTMLSHLFREEMGDKPYLHIEVDEHFSHVGVITRIEAFLNSLEQRKTEQLPADFRLKQVGVTPIHIYSRPQPNKPILIPELGSYSELIADYFNAQQRKTAIISSGNAEMQLGITETYSKEYAVFTLLLGTALQAAKSFRDAQILIPHTEGAEADNQYARVIDAVLREHNNNLAVYSPCMEQIPQTAGDIELLFRALLAGDMYYIAPASMRENYLFTTIPAMQDLIAAAQQLQQSTVSEEPYLSVVGDPVCMYSIAAPILNQLEREGYRLRRMPLAEYMLFLWKQCCKGKKQKQMLQQCQECLLQISKILGPCSPYHEALMTEVCSDEQMKRFAGGNGTYRFMKILQEKDAASGILSIAPQYENTELILGMQPQFQNMPLYHLEIGNRWENSDWMRLHSFLYYTKPDDTISL